MANVLSRLASGVAHLPRRILDASGWAHLEPTGYGAGPVHTEDLDELEAKRRREREAWRQRDDDPPPDST